MNEDLPCVERGVWTPVPIPPPRPLRPLSLKAIDPAEDARCRTAGVLTFHAVGCTGDLGDHTPQLAVATAMTGQIMDPGRVGLADGDATTASFLFHLGDVTYTGEDTAASDDIRRDDANQTGVVKNQSQLYRDQFFLPYHGYRRAIVAIAGNHDGKMHKKPKRSPIQHFLTTFCAEGDRPSPDNDIDDRPTMPQPYVYWRLETPLASIIGLYSNVANGGILDDPTLPDTAPHPQYDWLVSQLRDLRRKNARRRSRKAILLAVHYPPYSGAANFAARGDPTRGPTQAHVAPLAERLQQAFVASGQRPDAILSAHAHLYQRLTYRYVDGWELPCLVAGSGGHAPIEDLWRECDGKTKAPQRSLPIAAILPAGSVLPPGDAVAVIAANDQSSDNAFGFLRLTITAERLTGEFFAATPGPLTLADSFVLDLATHHLG